MKRKPNISKAKEHLGWEPKVKLAEGLKPMIEVRLRQCHELCRCCVVLSADVE
jgi:nucleoside-diphosphate-sugar epimerase